VCGVVGRGDDGTADEYADSEREEEYDEEHEEEDGEECGDRMSVSSSVYGRPDEARWPARRRPR